MNKVLRFLLRGILFLFLFILVLGFIIIPLSLTWGIPSQGTKYLKHPVHLQSVQFNPFILQLTLKGFEVLDHQNRQMIAFDKLMVEVSFKDLFKKIYHVEAFEVDGLKLNVELLPNNQVNLVELVPQEQQKPVAVTHANKQVAPLNEEPLPLPAVVVDKIDLNGQVHFTDKTVSPPFSTALTAFDLSITNVSTDPEAQADVKFKAQLDNMGRISTEVFIKPLAKPLDMETSFNLNDYALVVLTPYVGKYTGRALKDGKLDLRMNYRISANKLTASHRLLIQKFEFGNSIQSKDALPLPFGLAVALLEDPRGEIKIALPVSGDMSDPKFEYTHLIFQVIRNFFMKLVTSPFSVLGSLLGEETGTDELGYVRFTPGKAFLSGAEKNKLAKLIKGLKERPKLRLEVDGSYDPLMDWRAIEAESFAKDYELLRKQASGPDAKVYQLLYQRRFGIRGLWALGKKYKKGWGSYDDEKFDQEIKRQLIENAPPDLTALNALARSRAQEIHDFLMANGFEGQHLNIGHPQSTQGSMGYVPLPFTLTIFDK